ncbi:MAG TPA: EamA family transporter [Polyangiaceae bacterium]
MLRPPMAPRPALVYSLMAVVAVVWGSTWLVIKQGLETMPPLLGAGLRFVVAGALMACLAPWLVKREGGGRPPLGVMLAHCLCQFVLNFALVYYTETVLPSGLVSVLWSVFPLLVALTGHFVTKTELLVGRQWAGMVVALAGIVALFATDIASISPRAVTMGLLLLLGPLSVTYSTALMKLRAAGSSSIILNRDAMALGGVLLLGLSFLFERDQPVRFTGTAVASVLYLAVFGSVLTFGIYVWLLRTVPAYRLSLVSYVIPAIAIWLGATFGNEPVRATTLAGTGLVIAGVALALRKSAPPVSEPEAAGSKPG